MKLTADWIMDAGVQRLIRAFETRGHQIFFVGGCVRNTLLDQTVADIDLSTSAVPEQTIEVAKEARFKFIPTGLEYGTITVLVNGQSYEITSFRKDVETHGRRAVVAFSDNIMEDALRRDFTMNALYADGRGEVVDPLNGIGDLHNRYVRFIADAQKRIREDYLRILRYFRFHAWYADQDGGIDPDAMAAIAMNLDGLSLVSKERIGIEFRKILSAEHPLRTLAAMEHSGVLMQILPCSNTRALGPLLFLEENLGLTGDWMRRLICLGGENQVENLRLSKAERKRIVAFYKAVDHGAECAETAYRFGRDTTLDMVLVTAAASESHPAGHLMEQIKKGCAAKFPIKAVDLPSSLTGKAIGDLLNRLENDWINSGFSKTKTTLLADV